MNRLILWGLPTLLVCGVLANVLLRRAAGVTPSPAVSTAELIRLREVEDDELLLVYQDVIDRILLDVGRSTLTHDRCQQLQLAGRFLVGFIQRYSEDRRSTRPAPLISAYRQLGLTNLLLRDYTGSEKALRESLEIAEAASAADARGDVQAMQAMNEGSLGWLMAMTGRLAEAEACTKSTVRRWEQLVQRFPERATLNTEAAISRRNLAMIRDAAGTDGLAEAIASVDSAAAALAKTPADQSFQLCRCYETLIDSEQFLAMLCWQKGRMAEAEQSCRASIDHLHQLLSAIESLFDTTQLIPRSKKYWEALTLAQRNLELVSQTHPVHRRDTIDSETLPTDTDEAGWQWKLLKMVPGHVLSMDLVAHGNRVLGEFERQDALLVSWQEEWIFETLTSIVSAVHEFVPVIIMVDDATQQLAAERQLKDAGILLDRIQFIQAVTDTPWIRDYGPLCVQSASRAPLWLDPIFTYASSAGRFEDDELPHTLARSQNVSAIHVSVHLQGGGILTNGAGICLVSTDLLDRNHRLGVGEAQLVGAIRQYFGAEQVVFLDPLIGEPTGHIDWFCAFTSPDTIVVGLYGDDDPVNRDLLDRHAARLAELDAPRGKLNVVRIPMPPRAKDYFGGSYTNVIFANGVLVVPTWPEASAEVEQQVLDQYRQLLPGWTMAPVPSRRLGLRGGGPHCCSMNLLLRRPAPAAFAESDPGT